METKKLTAKIGNWQETVAMQKLLNGQVYDPRIKASGTLTKMRVIAHDGANLSFDCCYLSCVFFNIVMFCRALGLKRL